MTQSRLPGISVPITFLFLLAALLVRAWLRTVLSQGGMDPVVAKDLSYFAVPITLALLLWPDLRGNMPQLRELFHWRLLTPRLIVYAVLIGALMRVAYWAQLVGGVALGLYRDPVIPGPVQPEFGFDCPDPPVLVLGFVLTAILTPIVEEFVHRGLIQTALSPRGPAVAVGVSALLFMVVHRPSGWWFALAAGVVFGVLFWKTRSLWPPLLAHATINAIILLDWGCLRSRWNPPAEHLPILPVTLASALILAFCITVIAYLLCKKMPGSTGPPGNDQVTERLRPVR